MTSTDTSIRKAKKKTRGFVTQLDPDDYCVHNVRLVRIERMSENTIWGCFYPADGRDAVHFNISAKGPVNMVMTMPNGKQYMVAQ